MKTVKEFLDWIICTYNNLGPYDRTFDYGNKYLDEHNKGRLVGINIHDFASFYITKLLIIYLNEFLTLINNFKYEPENSNFKLNEKAFKNKLKHKLDIDYDLEENQKLISRIANSKIFNKSKQTVIINGVIINQDLS